jgi:hypothetical protein
VEGTGLVSGLQQSNGTAKFEVLLRDDTGAPVPKSSVDNLEILVEGPSGEIVPRLSEVANDTSKVLVEYDASLAGAYQVMVSLAGQELGEAPYTLDVILVVSALKCSAAGPGLENGAVAGQATDLTVVTRDICGNPCLVGGCFVTVEVDASAGPGASSPRLRGPAETVVKDRENGAYDVTIKYPAAGSFLVTVKVNGEPISGCPFSVSVEKPASAGNKWQAKFEEESDVRRKEREKERLQEIERAKEKYREHAEEAISHAKKKEAAELAEKQRQLDIEEHMERMRSEEGDQVRAAVLEKVKAQASATLYEPVEDPLSPSTSGKKWAAQFNDEDTKRRAAREAERQAEISRAKDNYLEHASEAVNHALTKEEAHLAAQARLRAIKEHQEDVRTRNKMADGGDDVSSGESVSSDNEAPATGDAKANAGEESSEVIFVVVVFFF